MQNENLLNELPGHNVIKRAKGEGEVSQIANLRLIWKARGPEIGYQFSIYEMILEPGVGIPLHRHPTLNSLWFWRVKSAFHDWTTPALSSDGVSCRR